MQEKENKFKKYNKLLNIIIVAMLFLSIGYAQITAQNLDIEGTASAYEKEGVYVSNVTYSSSNNANVNASETKQRVGATVVSKVILGNSQSSSITYQITTTNSTTSNYVYVGPAVSENFYSNNDIEYSVSGISVGDRIAPSGTKTFNLTYSYASGHTPQTQTEELDAYINFGFRELYMITYTNIQGSGYPDSVIKYRDTDGLPIELNVDFGVNAPTDLVVTGVDTGTEYVLGTDYTYNNGVLYFPNVSESLNVEQPIPNDPPIINSFTEEQQDTRGTVKLSWNVTDDHGIDHYTIETYEVVNGVDTLLTTDTATGNATDFTKNNLTEGGTYYFVLTAVDLGDLTATMPTTQKEYRWNLNVTINITNGGPNGTSGISFGDSYSTTLTANNNYTLPNNITVTMGTDTLTAGTDYTYTQGTGAFSISRVTGDLNISGTATGGICLIEGTKVRLANGTTKNIEDIDYNDLLLVWSYEEGRVVEEYPLWIEKGKQTSAYIKLTFSDNSTINIYNDHAFFSRDKNEFVRVADEESFHVGTRILKLTKDNKPKEVRVTKIETVYEDKMYYFVASTRYYNIITDDFITTDSYVDITNLYPFDKNAKWYPHEVQEIDYEYLKDVLPYYMYKGFRAGEVAVLLNNNKTNLETFRIYIRDLVLADNMLKKPKEINGSRYWTVSFESNWDSRKQVKEGSTYKLPFEKNTRYWYSTSENKYYKPGDTVTVWTGMHFERVK